MRELHDYPLKFTISVERDSGSRSGSGMGRRMCGLCAAHAAPRPAHSEGALRRGGGGRSLGGWCYVVTTLRMKLQPEFRLFLAQYLQFWTRQCLQMWNIRSFEHLSNLFEYANILPALPGFDTQRGTAETPSAVSFLACLP